MKSIQFVHATLPVAPARELANACNPIAAAAPHFVVKTAIARALGETAMRPWRLWTTQMGLYHLVAPWKGEAPQPTPETRRLGMVMTTNDWSIPSDEPIAFRVLTPASVSVFTPDTAKQRKLPAGWRFKTDERGQVRLVAPTDDERKDALIKWGVRHFAAPRTGLASHIATEIVDDRDDLIPINDNSTTIPWRKRVADLRITAKCADANALATLIGSGMSTMKHLGYGAVIPERLLLDIAV
jgi:hypothetical protein